MVRGGPPSPGALSNDTPRSPPPQNSAGGIRRSCTQWGRSIGRDCRIGPSCPGPRHIGKPHSPPRSAVASHPPHHLHVPAIDYWAKESDTGLNGARPQLSSVNAEASTPRGKHVMLRHPQERAFPPSRSPTPLRSQSEGAPAAFAHHAFPGRGAGGT